MNSTQFKKSVHWLYGNRWQADAGRLLGLSRRHVSRLAEGVCPVKPEVRTTIRRELRSRAADIAFLLAELTGRKE